MFCVVGSKKFDLAWGLKQLREVWSKSFKPASEDDAENVEMTETEVVSAGKECSDADEDDFQREMRLQRESSSFESSKTVQPLTLKVDQLEEWLNEPPVPYVADDDFSKHGIFQYWHGQLKGHYHVYSQYPDVVRMWRQFHGAPASGGGVERVFSSAGKQHDDLKKRTRDKILESTMKAAFNTKLPSRNDKGVFHDDDGAYLKRQ